MIQNENLPSIGDVSRKMRATMLRRLSWIFGVSCFFIISFSVTLVSIQQSNAVFDAIQYNLIETLKVHDKFEVSRQLNSILKSDSFAGFWLYDSGGLVVESVGREEPGLFSTQFNIQILEGQPFIVTQHKIHVAPRQQYSLVLTSKVSPWPFLIYFMMTTCLLVYLSGYFRRKIDALATTLSSPLKTFEGFVANQKPGEWGEFLEKEKLGYQEIDNLNRRFYELQSGLRERDQRLESSAKAGAIAQMTAMIAHDLKTPLAVVEQVSRLNELERFHELRPRLQSALERMHSMINALKKTDPDALVVISEATLDLERITSESLPLAECFGVALKAKTSFTPQIMADRSKLERAVQNLVVNAIESGAKNVTLSCHSTNEDLTIEISDDGPGVDKTFEPFLFQKGKTSKPKGTGLGLSWVMDTAKGHGGYASYQRETDLSIFKIVLPNCVIPKEEHKSVHTESEPRSQLNRNRILIAFKSTQVQSNYMQLMHSHPDLVVKAPDKSIDVTSFGGVCTDDFALLDLAMAANIHSHFPDDKEEPEKVIRILRKKIELDSNRFKETSL